MRAHLAGCLIVVAAGGLYAQQQPPRFRTTVDLVTIDVAVRSRSTPLAGLPAEAFEVLDNGVKQQVEMIDAASLAIDLTVVLDISGSMMDLVGPMTEYANHVLELLHADDRLRLVTVGTYVRQRFDFSRAAERLQVEEIQKGEMTSLYDGIAAALMRSRQPDRRHLVVALSDGYDTTSTLTIDTLEVIARRTDSMLFIVLPSSSGTGSTRRFFNLPDGTNTRRPWSMPRYRTAPSLHPAFEGPMDILVLKSLAEVTGGEFDRVFSTPGGLSAILKDILEKFRHTYVLRYRAMGVKREGWHDVTVRLPNHPGVEIRARKGYFGG